MIGIRDIIRTVRLKPYRSGLGLPTFTLVVWDCHRPHNGGPQWQLGYELRQHNHDGRKPRTEVIFSAEDFGCSPMIGIDSDECMAGILGFLTLQLGDTDDEYFEDYTPRQIEFRDSHAEPLSAEAMYRFEKE